MITKNEALDFLKLNSINSILEKLEGINTQNSSKTITFSKMHLFLFVTGAETSVDTAHLEMKTLNC